MEKYNNTAVHCPTLEIAERVEKRINKILGKNRNLAKTGFGNYFADTCLMINCPEYCYKQFYVDRDYIILTAEEFLNTLIEEEKYKRTVVHCPTLEIAQKVEEKINKIYD